MAEDERAIGDARASILEAALSLKATAASLSQQVNEVGERQAALTIMAGKIEELAELAKASLELRNLIDRDKEVLSILEEDVLPTMQALRGEHDKLRVVLLGKIDGLQDTVDLVREDVRNSWSTADFAITNSRHGREEVDKLVALVSTMQRQQQLLTSQVDDLRKAALERGSDE